MHEPGKALIERLFSAHGSALQAFFRRRIHAKPEAPDLTQEVYLRMLRIDDAEDFPATARSSAYRVLAGAPALRGASL